MFGVGRCGGIEKEILFSEAVRRMVGAFEKRARDLYGAPSQHGAGEPAT